MGIKFAMPKELKYGIRIKISKTYSKQNQKFSKKWTINNLKKKNNFCKKNCSKTFKEVNLNMYLKNCLKKG